MSEFEFKGGRELEAALLQLPHAASKRVARFALTKAAKPIEAMAASLAPDDPATGAPDLHRSMKTASVRNAGRSRSNKFVGSDQVEVHVGPTSEAYPQALLREFGHRDRAGGWVAASPYMRPAWDLEGGLKALDRIKQPLWDAIKRAAARAKKG